MNKEVSLCFTALFMVILITTEGMLTANQVYLEAILIDIKLLRKMLPNREGTFYTPKNIGVKCKRSAMKCFIDEINILEENEDNRNITNIIQTIQRNFNATLKQVAERDAKEEKMCPLCESYEAQNYVVFLNHMIELLQFAFRTGL